MEWDRAIFYARGTTTRSVITIAKERAKKRKVSSVFLLWYFNVENLGKSAYACTHIKWKKRIIQTKFQFSSDFKIVYCLLFFFNNKVSICLTFPMKTFATSVKLRPKKNCVDREKPFFKQIWTLTRSMRRETSVRGK